MRRLASRVHVDDADAGALRAWIDAEDAGHCGAVVVGRRPAGAASAAPTRPVAFTRTRPRPARHCCRRSARSHGLRASRAVYTTAARYRRPLCGRETWEENMWR